MFLIDPTSSKSCEEFYKKVKFENQIILPSNVAYKIREEAGKTYNGILSSLKSPIRITKIVTVLSLFALKRPDIGFHPGMNFIVAIILSVADSESDAFILFSHLIENIFPVVRTIQGYFLDDNRKLVMHREQRIFSLMALKLLPNLANSLKVIFKQEAENKEDYTPFMEIMKRIQNY